MISKIKTVYGEREFIASRGGLFRPKQIAIAFHGFMQTAQSFQKSLAIDDLAAERGIVIIYPQGRYRNWFTAVNYYSKQDIEFVSALMKNITKYYKYISLEIDKFVLLGLSDGAYFANYVGNIFNEKVSSLVSFSGGFKGQFSTKNKYPVLIYQYERDFLVWKSVAKNLEKKYIAAGHAVSYNGIPGIGHFWNSSYNDDIIKSIKQ